LASSAHPRELHSFPTRRSSDLPYSGGGDGAVMETEIDETYAAEPFLRRYELLKTDASALARLERKGRAAYANVHDPAWWDQATPDRKSTRLNSSHVAISYAVFC